MSPARNDSDERREVDDWISGPGATVFAVIAVGFVLFLVVSFLVETFS